jgi:exodeoxyribonuclease VII small subunit
MPVAEPTADDVSYEAARDELLEVVRQLEAGGLPLEKSLALWERGEELAVICQNWLDGARKRLDARRPATTQASDDDEN